jgi:hypothetical protein
VKDRGLRARGFLKDITRPHIEKAFGFTPSTNKKVVQKNVDRYLELMEGRIFHYKVRFDVPIGILSTNVQCE